MEEAREREEKAIIKHAELFSNRQIAIDMLKPLSERVYAKLKELYDQGKIPSTSIPILKERLTAELCICGATLSVHDLDGKKRRTHIKKMINDSETADQVQKGSTELYFRIGEFVEPKSNTWLDLYAGVVKEREGIDQKIEEYGKDRKKFERQLEDIPDTNIDALRKTREILRNKLEDCTKNRWDTATEIDELKEKRQKLEKERDKVLHAAKIATQIFAKKDVVSDIMKVLKSMRERLIDDDLLKVNRKLNDIFLAMIISDPDQGSIIQQAKISDEYSIEVYGPDQKELNPDRDLNGSSRRALTLAFILALTKISEVEAPSVIDTPIGMTSGSVRRAMLKTAISESSQLVLLLTPDEIRGCEDIIDENVGEAVTLTNSTHYPAMLVNPPNVPERSILCCQCNHRAHCSLCQRREDVQPTTGGKL